MSALFSAEIFLVSVAVGSFQFQALLAVEDIGDGLMMTFKFYIF